MTSFMTAKASIEAAHLLYLEKGLCTMQALDEVDEEEGV